MENPLTENEQAAVLPMSEEAEASDAFKTVIAILIAVVAVVGAVVAWRAALNDASAGDADFAGIRANINAAETRIINMAALYENYRAYLAATRYREQEKLFLEAINKTDDEVELETLNRDWAVATQLASDNEFYYSKRFLNEDGSYNRSRELGEAWARAAQKLELDPAPHFAEADQLRRKSNRFIAIFIVLSFTLLFFTLAEGIDRSRALLRYTMAALGLLFLLYSVVAAAIVELA